jgi:lipoate-protein ligase A
MAVDAALVEAVRDGASEPVLRFYRWTPPCVTLGKFQAVEGNVRLDNCARLGIDVARRPTGGRAILHDAEVTFSTILRETDLPGAGSGVMDSYRALGTALVDGLRRLGLNAELVDRKANTRSGDELSAGNPACFAAKARCDLMVDGKKIIGSAQMRKDGVILQQNSLPLAVEYPRWDDVFYQSDWEAVAHSGMIDLHTAAGRPVPHDDVVAALCAGFSATLGITLACSDLTAAECARTEARVGEFTVDR